MKNKVAARKKLARRATPPKPPWTPASRDSTKALLDEVVKALDAMRGVFAVAPDWVKLEVKRNKNGTCDFVYREGGDAELVKNAIALIKRLYHPKKTASGLVFKLDNMFLKLTARGKAVTVKGRLSQDNLIKAIVSEFVNWRHAEFLSGAEWRKARKEKAIAQDAPKIVIPHVSAPTPPDFGEAFVVNGVDHAGVIKSAITVIENDFLREMSPQDSVKALLEVIPKEILSEFIHTVFQTEETVIKKVKWISPATILKKGEWAWFKQFYDALVQQLEQPSEKETNTPLYS